MPGQRRFPKGSIAEFDALIACYRSGQMSERQWEEHRSDKVFASYADRQSRRQAPNGTRMKPVIVRTINADAYFGYLKRRHGSEVELEHSRRLWHWNVARTLSEIATTGVDGKDIMIDAPVSIVLTEAIEIIDCTTEAVRSIEAMRA